MEKDPILEKLIASGRVKVGQDEKQRTQMGKPFPLVLEPAEGMDTSFVNLQEFLQSNHETVLKAASEYGAVLFSGFKVISGEEWASCLYKTSLQEMNYVGGAAVRRLIVGNDQRMTNLQVLTTNESPPSEPIPFHHELAQTPYPPSHICFYCSINDAAGGSTPILRSDMVYEYMAKKHPEFTEKVEKLGLKYMKIAPEEDDPSSALGRSWKSMFHVQTHEEAEKVAAEQGSTLEWLEDGCCRISSSVLPGIRTSSNGNKTFFNQLVASYTAWVDKRNKQYTACVYGDGTPLPHESVMDIVAFMFENQVAYRWTPGRFVIVDNTVAYHSREPFTGRRLVYAAIANGVKPCEDKQPHLALTSGDKMPMFGLGLWQMDTKVCADIVYNAIKCGYRMLDSAEVYNNEAETGQGIKRALDEGIVKREDLFIVSKLWCCYHRPENVKAAVKRSLRDLGVEYLDLYLIHYPIATKYVSPDVQQAHWAMDRTAEKMRMEHDMGVTYQETWHAMEELVREGLVKNIGVSNIGVNKLYDLMKYAKIKPAILQNEMHPHLTQENQLRYARTNGIQVMAYSSFGDLSTGRKGQSFMEKEELLAPAKKYGKTPGQVALRWALQRGTCVMPKSEKVSRIEENIKIFDFMLNDAEMKAISSLNKNERYLDTAVFTEQLFDNFTPTWD